MEPKEEFLFLCSAIRDREQTENTLRTSPQIICDAIARIEELGRKLKVRVPEDVRGAIRELSPAANAGKAVFFRKREQKRAKGFGKLEHRKPLHKPRL